MKKTDVPDRSVGIRMRWDEFQEVCKSVEANGTTLSKWIRSAISKKLKGESNNANRKTKKG